MTRSIGISVGQYSDRGRKAVNQDFHGFCMPAEPQRGLKGIAFAVADGIGSSAVSHIASETAVRNFLDDYYCTSEAWSVRTAGEQVLNAINSWLWAQTRRSEHRYDRDRGYVCTLSALVLKGEQAHLFHVGDSRIYRLRDGALEQLTHDHRLWLSSRESYLSRALGSAETLELDYRRLALRAGDIFILTTDGVHEYVDADAIVAAVQAHPDDLDAAAQATACQALDRGSPDNLTLQILRIDSLPRLEVRDFERQAGQLPLPPLLEAGQAFDGYRIVRELHASSRSHVYLAEDEQSGARVALKIPSIDQRDDPAYLERLLLEEWIARRLDSPHVLAAARPARGRGYLYTATEYVEGRTLAQWLRDNPRPDLETVRGIVEQIARGLRAFHRLEMLHQDLRPENLLIDAGGTLKIIDFGSTRVAGIAEAALTVEQPALLGTALYSAPEYFLGEHGSVRSDLYSLGVIAYQLLSGRFPYGTEVARAKTAAAQRRLAYRSVLDDEREIPAWIDDTLKKALQPNPYRRYAELSEFLYDLRHPSPGFLNKSRPPLMERDPVLFWKGVSLALSLAVVFLLVR